MLNHAEIAQRTPLRRALAVVVSAVLFAGALTVGLVAPAAAAPPASSFDPGMIISDSVMFDYGAMTETDIQNFLDLKVPVCNPNSSVPCLKDYTADTRDVAPVANRCTGGIVGAKNVPAARILYEVSVACQVNPKVLLVTLQKEQGLVTKDGSSAAPLSALIYRKAMGYGCPDTASCDSAYYGFFNQVYQAAYAFNKYTKSPTQYTAYQPGTRKIGYHPKSSCGTATVKIRNKATSALYFYTPYVPNAAALANMYGTGDSCSSYGNRNFWRYFNDWFGSPVGGSFIVDTDAASTYVLISGARWEIPRTRSGLLTTLSPLGKTGRVSAAYAEGFPIGGTFGNLVASATGQLFLLDNGRKLTVTDCAQAADYGYSCGAAVPMPDDMLAYFPTQGALPSVVSTTSGALFALGSGVRREILDAASAAAAGIALPATPALALLDDTIAAVPYGAPAARPGVLALVRGTTDSAYITTRTSYTFARSLVTETKLTVRLGSAVGSLDPASLALLSPRVSLAGLLSDPATGASYVITKSGKATVTNPAALGGTFVPVDAELLSALPTSTETITAPAFLKSLTSKTKFLVTAGKSRPATTSASVKALAAKFSTSTATTSVAGQSILALAKPFVKPGTVVKASKKSTALWFIDGAAKKRSVTKAQAKELTGSTKARVIPASTLKGFATVKGSAKPGLKSAGVYYIADAGVLRVVSASDAKRYGSKYGFGSYDSTTIAALKKGVAIGRVITSGSKYYEVKNSKKVRITATRAKALAATTGKKTQAVSTYFASLLVTK